MSTAEALSPCIVCNRPVSIDCHCRICNGRLHCFCAVPEGLEGHGGIYLCSADCRGSQHTPPTTPKTPPATPKRITVHVGGEQWSIPTNPTSPDPESRCSPPTIQNTTTSPPNRHSSPTIRSRNPPTFQNNTTTSPNRRSSPTTRNRNPPTLQNNTTTSPNRRTSPTARNRNPPTSHNNTTTSPNRRSPSTTRIRNPPTIQNTTTSPPNRRSPRTTQHVIQELPSFPPLLDVRGNANFLPLSEESNNSGGDTGSDGEEPTIVDNSIVETAKFLLSHHPLKKFERLNRWTKHQLCDAQQQDIEPVDTFLRSLCDLPFCFNFYHRRFTSCTCLREISEHFLFEDVAQMLGK